jgi:FAD/FMN-containing dehydrogenase
MNRREAFAAKKAQLLQQFAAGDPGVRLQKQSSNLFRDREKAKGARLDVRSFGAVLEVNPDEGWVDVEGMTPYDALTDETLANGTMPAVVPQLKSITIGGAAAGVGIEATSFRHGLVHDTLLELEVLTGDGQIVVCTPDGPERDLFYGFPNSYGTLGYALRLKAGTIPVKPAVHVERHRHQNADTFFADLATRCTGEADFIDGVVFAQDELFINEARFVDQAPALSDYSYQQIYYRSIREKPSDFLSTRGYIWRWDTDWFWCSNNIGAQHPLLRRLYGRKRLNSRFYTKVMRWNSRWGLTRALDRLSGRHTESVIQDVDIPIEHAAEFLRFFQGEIGILPIWVCPFQAPDPQAHFDLYPVKPGQLYVNFGFWDAVRTRAAHPKGHFNRLVERKVAELDGIKSLYSNSYYPRSEFWAIYGAEAYSQLKRKYDPEGRFKDLYAKCVLRE